MPKQFYKWNRVASSYQTRSICLIILKEGKDTIGLSEINEGIIQSSLSHLEVKDEF
jgi:hypothetical protein